MVYYWHVRRTCVTCACACTAIHKAMEMNVSTTHQCVCVCVDERVRDAPGLSRAGQQRQRQLGFPLRAGGHSMSGTRLLLSLLGEAIYPNLHFGNGNKRYTRFFDFESMKNWHHNGPILYAPARGHHMSCLSVYGTIVSAAAS